MKTSLHPGLIGGLSALLLAIFLVSFGVLGSAKEEVKNLDSITLLFTGDMMFDRGVRKTIESKSFDMVFGDSKKIFVDADIVIANLEGPITSYPSRILRPDGTTSEELNFTFPVGTAKALSDNGVDIVNLANNHTANQGTEGLEQTKKYLREAGVDLFGHPGNKDGQRATTTCKDNFCIALIGWHEFAATPASDISADIKKLRTGTDIVVVLPHWGIEYEKQPTARHQAIARSWIDAGADLIIGTHPHVIQSIEEYKGKVIFYSLGNFIFDQYFSFDTTHGLAVSVTATKEASSTGLVSFEYKLLPVRNVGTVVSIPDAETTLRILKGLAQTSATYVSKTTQIGIEQGNLSMR